jgi:DNA invertase Pin-like site-specific DNA recombinase
VSRFDRIEGPPLDTAHSRTLAGLEAARARGKKGGRKVEAPLRQMQAMAKLVESNEITVAEACRELGIGRTTWYRHMRDPHARQTAVLTGTLAVDSKVKQPPGSGYPLD